MIFGFGKKKQPENPEHVVIVDFDYGKTDLTDLFELEDELIEKVEEARVGEVDGHEIAMDASHGFFFLYGPDADRLFQIAEPVLISAKRVKIKKATLFYGSPKTEGVESAEIDLQPK